MISMTTTLYWEYLGWRSGFVGTLQPADLACEMPMHQSREPFDEFDHDPFDELDDWDWVRPKNWLPTWLGWTIFLGSLVAIGAASWILTTPDPTCLPNRANPVLAQQHSRRTVPGFNSSGRVISL